MVSCNPFSVSQSELDSLKASLDALAADYVAPLVTLGEGLDRLSETFRPVGRSEPETREALRDLARQIEGFGLSDALRARQGHEFWKHMREGAARVAQPAIGSNPATKRHPAKFGREYAEAGYSLNQLLDAETWAEDDAAEAHLAIVMSGGLAWWELRDCGDALVRALRRRTLPEFAPRFEAMTVGNLAWPELREAEPFGEPERFALGDWREWLNMRDAYRPASINACLSLGTMPRFAAKPDAPDEVLAAPTDPPDGPGFPHPEDYLPEGTNNAVADTWPMAQRQLAAFWESVGVGNDKLMAIDSRLPHGLADWWVKRWADALLFRSHLLVRDAAGVRAWYEFGRVLDGELRISATPSESPHPYDAEFTYYDRPLMRDDGRGKVRPQPFAGFGYRLENEAGLTPVAFPNSPAPLPNMPRHRLCCEQLLEWAGFLVSPEPLTAGQVEALGHVGCSTVGVDGWCLVGGTHGEQCGALGVRVSNRLREAIRQASDALRISVETIPQVGRLDEALDRASNWLVRARAPEAARCVTTRTREIIDGERNAVALEQDALPNPPRSVPVWDAKSRTLTIGAWKKQAALQAKNVTRVLGQFQSKEWSTSSITPDVRADLDDLRKSLNDWLGNGPPITFSRDGTGKGIQWGFTT